MLDSRFLSIKTSKQGIHKFRKLPDESKRSSSESPKFGAFRGGGGKPKFINEGSSHSPTHASKNGEGRDSINLQGHILQKLSEALVHYFASVCLRLPIDLATHTCLCATCNIPK